MRYAVSVVLLATRIAHADPATDFEDLDARRAVIAADATCIPRTLQKQVDLQLGLVEKQPVLCANGRDTELKGPIACWRIAGKKLVPVPPTLLPGLAVDANLSVGCANGLCIPQGEVLADRTLISVDARGAQAALIQVNDAADHLVMFIFDRATRAFQKKVAVDAGVPKLVWTGDQLATPACGRTCTLTIRDLAKTSAQKPATLDFAQGTITQLQPGVLALGDAAWMSFDKLDVATGKVVHLRKKKPPKKLDPAKVAALAGARVVASGGGYYVALRGPRDGHIAAFDAQLNEKASFDAFCKQ